MGWPLAGLLVRPPVSTLGQGCNPRPQYVLFLSRRWPASWEQEMQSTVNYLWHTDDLLGQGATASVYKARNKVGCSPAHPGPLAARKSAPSGQEGWCELAGQGSLTLFCTL